jgi:hypothetical protein
MALKRGDRGDAVKQVQRALIAAGFGVGNAGADGIFGKDTEAAVKGFQRRNNLDDDGIVGPITLRALGLAAGGGNVDWPAAKREVVRIAKHEFEVVWDHGRKKEDDPGMRPVLLNYYQVGVGMSREDILEELHQGVRDGEDTFAGLSAHLEALALKDPADLTQAEGDELLSQAWFVRVAWSAVFISWVMEKAGAGGQFRNARAHWRYVKAAKENTDADNPIQAFKIDAVAPEEGDIVVTGRPNKTKTNKKATWDDFEGTLTHGDVVVAVGANQITGIGGNVSNSVKDTPVDLNADGTVQSSGGQTDWDHFAVVQIVVP